MDETRADDLTTNRVFAMNLRPAPQSYESRRDLYAQLAPMKGLRVGRRHLAGLAAYVTTSGEHERWRHFHAAFADGNFEPLAEYLVRGKEEPSFVVFGLVAARPLGDYLRSVTYPQLRRQLAVGLAGQYSTLDAERRCGLRNQVLPAGALEWGHALPFTSSRS